MRKGLTWFAYVAFFVITVFPLLWVLMSSFKDGASILRSPWEMPAGMAWENYGNAWTTGKLGASLVRSLITTVATLALLLPIGAMAAYVLARFTFKGKAFLTGTFLGGMMFPNILAAVPVFLLASKLKMYDTLWGLVIIYVAYSLSFTIFVLSGFFSAIPKELEEAAVIDGCGYASTFFRVVLPIAKPGLIVVGLFNGIGLWNEYNLAKVMMSAQNATLSVNLANLTNNQFYKADWGALFAGLVIVMLPVLVVYWLFKDRIQQAMLAGAIK
ncbi:MAG: carbohydrate ABC transporter permease [Armatimonadetes bacterium]|nr:carbohydrate ABC transporter permease [Armatimonadota bacterium]